MQYMSLSQEFKLSLTAAAKLLPIHLSDLHVTFGVSDRYFPNLQNDLDIRELKDNIESELSEIKSHRYGSV